MRKLLLYFFLAFNSVAIAQIQTNDLPYSLKNNLEVQLLRNFETVMPNQSIASAMAEDVINAKNGYPPRFGLKMETNFNLENSGVWTDLPTGDKLWRLRIKSPNAKSINLLYDSFHLPPGGKLHIYNYDKSHVIGGFTERNNQGTIENPGKFATGLVYGKDITLEYYHPSGSKNEAIISIKGVVHGYKHIKLLKKFANNEKEEIGFGDSGLCQVNVNCSEGDNWQNQKNGVGLMIMNGISYCTGSLISNTNEDGTPYFLSADHCIGSLDAENDTDASGYIFYWNYESPNCTSGTTEPTILSTSGATLRANRADSDFALFELTESPVDETYDVYFNGWDRTTNPAQGGVGIHHPSGDIKKIATHNIVPGPGEIFNANNHWRVNWIATANGFSVTEGGSSGSPLFMNNGRIIGQLRGGDPYLNCSDPANDPGEYGRFDVSWNGTTSTRRLRDWLDPGNTGAAFLDGKLVYKILGQDLICSGATYTYILEDATGGSTWTISSNLDIVISSGTSITVKAANIYSQGPGFITANHPNAIDATKEVFLGKPYADMSSPPIVCTNQFSELYTVPASEGAESYRLVSSSPYLTIGGHSEITTTSAPFMVNFLAYQQGSYLVELFTTNSCGTSRGAIYVTAENCTGGPGGPGGLESYAVYPNPASKEVSIENTSQEKGTEASTFAMMNPTAQLYDFNGILVKTIELDRNNVITELDVSSLKEGLYFLKIMYGNNKETHKIIVAR